MAKKRVQAKSPWYRPENETDLPENLNTRRLKPGDEGWSIQRVPLEQIQALYDACKEQEPRHTVVGCIHTRQSVGYVSGHFFQRCIDCGRVVPVEES